MFPSDLAGSALVEEVISQQLGIGGAHGGQSLPEDLPELASEEQLVGLFAGGFRRSRTFSSVSTDPCSTVHAVPVTQDPRQPPTWVDGSRRRGPRMKPGVLEEIIGVFPLVAQTSSEGMHPRGMPAVGPHVVARVVLHRVFVRCHRTPECLTPTKKNSRTKSGAVGRDRQRTGARRCAGSVGALVSERGSKYPAVKDAGSESGIPSVLVGSQDEALVAEALGGDRRARRRLAERLMDAIQREVAFSLARRARGTGRDARQELRDFVQDILVGLFSHDGRDLRRWDPARGRSLESFVRLVARRRVARALTVREREPSVAASNAPSTETGDEAEFLRRLEDRQTLDAVLTALYGKMNDRDHELFQLLYVEQIEPAEVAQRLSLSRGAVNAWSYRMRKVVRGLMPAQTECAGVSSKGGVAPMGEVSDV